MARTFITRCFILCIILLLVQSVHSDTSTDVTLHALQVKMEYMEAKINLLEKKDEEHQTTNMYHLQLIKELQTTISNQQNVIDSDNSQDNVFKMDHDTILTIDTIEQTKHDVKTLKKTVHYQRLLLKKQSTRITSLERKCRLQTLPVPTEYKNAIIKPFQQSGNIKTTEQKQSSQAKHADHDKHIYQDKQTDEDHENTLPKVKQMDKRLVLGMESPVAFMATGSSTINNIGIDQNIHFDTVQLNLGNSFHVLHGIFIAPQSGIYLFSSSIMFANHAQKNVYAAISHNGKDVAVLHGYNAAGYWDQGSQTAILQVNQGDEIWVRNKYWADTFVYGSNTRSFCGILLIPM